MTITFNIPDIQVSAAINDLSGYFAPFGFTVTEFEIESLLKINPSLICGLSDGGFDTFEREMAVDAYLMYILGISDEWPTNGDDQSYKDQFYEKLKSAKKI